MENPVTSIPSSAVRTWRKPAGLVLFFLLMGGGTWVRFIRQSSHGVPWRVLSAAQSIQRPELMRKDLKFTDVTRELGISFNFEMPKLDPMLEGKEKLFFLGSGVAVADVNGDGWMDILLVNAKKGAKNHLYINQGGHGFVDQAEEWGISDINSDGGATVSAVFFDYNNDGKPDLYLARLGCSMLFKNTGHSFVNVTQASGLGDCKNAVSAVPVDFDNDGNLDLYVIRYWNDHDFFHLDTPYVASENGVDSRNGGKKTLYRNRGDGTFEDVTDSRGGGETHWTLDAAAAAFTGDGTPFMLLSNDFGPDTLYAVRNGRLLDESLRMGVPDRRFGMGVSLGDLAGDGMPHVYVSNQYTNEYVQTGNFLWKFDHQGLAHDEAIARRVENCGWSWGSVFADFDLDGKEDLYVANGFISNGPVDEERKALSLVGKDGYEFAAATMMTLPGIYASDVRTWPLLKDRSYAGHEIGCFFWNTGDHFENVSSNVNLTREWDGRAVAAIDLDNSGSISLIVTTQNGPPHLLRNEIQPGKDWIGIQLIGTRSNRDGAGARVEVRQGAKRWYRWATSGKSGFLATSDPRLHFGVPGGGAVDVSVRWPSGALQEVRGLETGRYYPITEGAGR